MRIHGMTILDLNHRKRTIVLALGCLVLAVTAAQGQLPYIATSQNHFCAGSTDGITMYCNVLAFDPSTDVEDWSFEWEPALEVSDPTAQVITTTPGVTTDFSVIMTAPDGSVYTDEITITVFPVFSVDTGPDLAACSTLAEYLSAFVDVPDPVDWLWEPALGLSNATISNPQVLQEVTQVYTVTAIISASSAFSSGDACEASDQIEVISIFPAMDLGSDILACSGTEVILDPGLPVNYTYEWSVPGETLPVLSVLSSGSYGLNATSPEGCEQSDVIEVTFTEGPELALPESVEGCENPGILLDATPINTGTGPFQFAWSNGANEAVITVNESGVYDVLVSDAGNCSISGTVLVETLPSPNIALPADTSLCFDDYPEVSYQLAVPAGFASYSWTTGQTGNVISIEEAGLYGVVVTNDIGCSNEEMSLVQGFCSEPALFVPTAFTPDGDGLNETLRIEGKNLIELDFRLYNRWGALVWQADTIGDYWHGQAPQRTHYVQDDLYIWQAKYRHYLDANGQLSPYTEASGSVRILR
jgi:gliding motility-associated-like protein